MSMINRRELIREIENIGELMEIAASHGLYVYAIDMMKRPLFDLYWSVRRLDSNIAADATEGALRRMMVLVFLLERLENQQPLTDLY